MEKKPKKKRGSPIIQVTDEMREKANKAMKNKELGRRPDYVTGRPSDYREEYGPMLIEHMSQGYSYYSFAALVGCHRETLHSWEKQFSAFKECKMIGAERMLRFMETLGLEAMKGNISGFQGSTYIFTMKNKCKWSDNPQNEDTANKLQINYEDV